MGREHKFITTIKQEVEQFNWITSDLAEVLFPTETTLGSRAGVRKLDKFETICAQPSILIHQALRDMELYRIDRDLWTFYYHLQSSGFKASCENLLNSLSAKQRKQHPELVEQLTTLINQWYSRFDLVLGKCAA